MRTVPRSRRAAVVGAVLAVGLLFVMAGASPAQQDEAPAAILSQEGWWNRLQGPQESEPSTPLRGVLAPVPPPANTVPPNTLAVGAAGGDPDKVAAIGIVLEGPIDGFVDRLVLTLVEADENGANLNEGQAAVSACPIDGFWGTAYNGDWRDRPTCDDSQAVAGERADDGTWTFDLALVGQGWLDGTLSQLGILLVESVEAPQSFQLSFNGIATGDVAVDYTVTGAGSDPVFEPEPAPIVAPPATTGGEVGRAPSPPPTTAPVRRSPPTTEAVAPPATTAPRPEAIRSLDATIWGNLPLGVLLWAPLGLALAAALAFMLGPAGRPTAESRRIGSVSRVLDARQTAT